MNYPAISLKEYACSRCGTVVEQSTNHTGETYSLGHYNCCPSCPPWAKYSEFGGHTRWLCVQSMTTEQKMALRGADSAKAKV